MREKLIFTAKAKLLDDYNYSKAQAAFKTVAQSLEERGALPEELVKQPDLLAIQSVILTTGRPGNLNDDVILNEHIMGVLDTAAFKPFNLDHDTGSIIGVMFDAFAVDKETGEVIEVEMNLDDLDNLEDTEARRHEKEKRALAAVANIPERIDVINNAVVWALHFPHIAAELKNKAIQGEMFVSMEVFFDSFDFLVGNKIIKGNEETYAILSPILRIHGGSGMFHGEKVKRIPKNLTIGGIAATPTPANPESFILDVKDAQDLKDEKALIRETEAKKKKKRKVPYHSILESNVVRVLQSESKDDSTDTSHMDTLENHGESQGLGSETEVVTDAVVDMVVASNEENSMDKRIEELVSEKTELKNELEKAISSLAEANKAVEELRTRTAELESELDEKLTLISEKEAERAAQAEAMALFTTEKDELSAKLAEATAELAEIATARKLDERKAAIAEMPISDERKAKLVEENIALDDEAFAAKVADLEALIAELAQNAKVDETETTEEEVAETETEKVEEEEATDAEVLETAEEVAVAAASIIASETDAGSDEDEEASERAEKLGLIFSKTLLNK